jgi:hypothetical protein
VIDELRGPALHDVWFAAVFSSSERAPEVSFQAEVDADSDADADGDGDGQCGRLGDVRGVSGS